MLERAGITPRRAALFVLFAGAAFSTAGPLARVARPLDPLFVALGRLVVATLVLLAVDVRTVGAAVRGLSARKRWTVLLAGTLLALHFTCFLWGLDHTSLPAGISLVSLEPLGVVLAAWALLGVAPTRAEQLGVALATAGAIIVAMGSGVGEHRLVGDLVVVAAVVIYGLYLAVARALKDALPARSYAALVYASATAAMAVLLLFAPGAFTAPAWPPTSRGLLAILGLGLIPTVIGHTAVQTGSRVLPPAIVALVSPTETLGGLLIGAALLGASPTWIEITGALVIVAGTVVALPRTRTDAAAKTGENRVEMPPRSLD